MRTIPDLVKMDRATRESGDNQKISVLAELTGTRFHAQYPNHYAGDAKDANKEIGELSIEGKSNELAKLIKEVKADKITQQLQNDFMHKIANPLETEPWEKNRR
jgi:creatinine amidohydrolase